MAKAVPAPVAEQAAAVAMAPLAAAKEPMAATADRAVKGEAAAKVAREETASARRPTSSLRFPPVRLGISSRKVSPHLRVRAALADLVDPEVPEVQPDRRANTRAAEVRAAEAVKALQAGTGRKAQAADRPPSSPCSRCRHKNNLLAARRKLARFAPRSMKGVYA